MTSSRGSKERAEGLEISQSVLPMIAAHFEAQTSLCLLLEKIADSLPDKFDPQICLHAAQSIYPIIKKAHDFEEDVLFPMLEQKMQGKTDLGSVLNRLHGEHWEDESFGEEISEALKELVDGRQNNPEKLGYMLRGFFEGIRRHIAFEREHLLPLITAS